MGAEQVRVAPVSGRAGCSRSSSDIRLVEHFLDAEAEAVGNAEGERQGRVELSGRVRSRGACSGLDVGPLQGVRTFGETAIHGDLAVAELEAVGESSVDPFGQRCGVRFARGR